ncbi:hypothetical protein L7F22_054884 [Adiantum nelumboides]|nr:hypothetical protein [Adiantum nelumboides]
MTLYATSNGRLSLHQRALVAVSSSSSSCYCPHTSSRRVLRRLIGVAGTLTFSPPFTKAFRPGYSGLFSLAQRKLPHLNADHASVQSSSEASSAQPWWQGYKGCDENSRHFRHGPLPGDIAELEAFCRIFRLAEQMHNAVMEALISSSQDKCVHQCQLNGDISRCRDEEDSGVEDPLSLEDKVVSSLGRIGAFFINKERRKQPSKEQVAEFARLAADPENNPLYFHSQVGLGRTLSMVSRLHEFGSRTNFEKGAMLTGKPSLISSSTREEKEFWQNSLAAKHGVTERNGSLIEEQMVCLVGESVDKQADSLSSSVTPFSPFEAQRPAFNAFSKHGRRKFLKARQVLPTTFQMSGRLKKAVNLNAADSDEAITTLMKTIVEPAGRWGLDGPGIPRASRKDDFIVETGLSNMTNEVGKESGDGSIREHPAMLTHEDIASLYYETLFTSDPLTRDVALGQLHPATPNILEIASLYYETLFTSDPLTRDVPDARDEIWSFVRPVVSEGMQTTIMRPFSLHEVRDAV